VLNVPGDHLDDSGQFLDQIGMRNSQKKFDRSNTGPDRSFIGEVRSAYQRENARCQGIQVKCSPRQQPRDENNLALDRSDPDLLLLVILVIVAHCSTSRF